MPVGTTYRSGQAAKILGVSAHALRRLAEAGLVDADFTGSQWRFSVEEIQRLQREGLPPLPAIEQDGLRSARRPQGSNRLVTEGLLAAPSEELVADMGTTEEKGKAIGQVASTLANKIDADVILYAGPIAPPFDRNMIENCRKSGKRSNAYLIVVTYGGNPHAAYRIGRCLQRNYAKVTVCVPSICASAGTLLALAAHDLVMSDLGLLGPLDIQLQKTDELFETTSGLTVAEAVVTLRSEAQAMFRQTLLDLKAGSGGQITLRTSLDTAAQLTAGVIGPLFAQIDPMKLGEDGRSTRIIQEYGNRLNKKSENLKPEALGRLVAGYPSHLFDIDREEAAESLFNNVRPPNDDEKDLVDLLNDVFHQPPDDTIVSAISKPSPSKEKSDERANNTRDTKRSSATVSSPSRNSPASHRRKAKPAEKAPNTPQAALN